LKNGFEVLWGCGGEFIRITSQLITHITQAVIKEDKYVLRRELCFSFFAHHIAHSEKKISAP
jgi:hypothetical protein